MGSETDEELPNFSLQFSLTEGEMEEFIKQQRNPRTVKKNWSRRETIHNLWIVSFYNHSYFVHNHTLFFS